MEKYQFLKTAKKSLVYITILLLSGTVVWSLTSQPVYHDFFNASYSVWEDGWSQIIENETTPLDTITSFHTISVGDTLVLTNVIPNLTDDKVLFFYSKDFEITVYIGNDVIYNFEMQEDFSILNTPGHLWNTIEIPVEYSGESIRIELTSQFSDRFMGTVTNLYLIEESQCNSILMQSEGFRYLMSVVVLFMTIFAYVNALIWKRRKIKNFFLALGHFYLSIAMWLLSMCGILNIVLNRPVTNVVICNLMILIIPVTTYELFKTLYPRPSKTMIFVGILTWANFFIQFIAQFIFRISILTLLPLSYIVYALSALIALKLVLHHVYLFVKHPRKADERDFALMTTLLLFIGTVAEIVVLCLFPKRTDLIGVASITAACLYMIVNLIALSRFESTTDIEKIILSNDYKQLKNTTLVHQIKAHFFYNTLNNISALCKYDAVAADKAIINFAQYMHSYMHLINEQRNIPIMQEMELIRSSLEIELMRFPDAFTYTIDLEYDALEIPPLSLQPLVENALYHGLRSIKKGGHLEIRSRKANNIAQIFICDNGVGFDTHLLESKESIGLNNLSKRIALMTNGTVDIQSSPGQGTTIRIEIPLNYNE